MPNSVENAAISRDNLSVTFESVIIIANPRVQVLGYEASVERAKADIQTWADRITSAPFQNQYGYILSPKWSYTLTYTGRDEMSGLPHYRGIDFFNEHGDVEIIGKLDAVLEYVKLF